MPTRASGTNYNVTTGRITSPSQASVRSSKFQHERYVPQFDVPTGPVAGAASAGQPGKRAACCPRPLICAVDKDDYAAGKPVNEQRCACVSPAIFKQQTQWINRDPKTGANLTALPCCNKTCQKVV